jgi:hypothetical protein
LVIADRGALRVVPLDGSSQISVPTPPDGQTPVAVGDAIVFAAGGQAWALQKGTHGPLVTLGAADQVITGIVPGQVWLVQGQPSRSVTLRLRLACVNGPGVECSVLLMGPVAVPSGFATVAAAGRNLLLQGGTAGTLGQTRVWDAFRNQTLYSAPGALAEIIDSSATKIAWRAHGPGVCTDDDECPLHITDWTSGADQVVPAPPNRRGYIGGGSFSPDGRLLAAFVTGPPADSPQGQLAVIDLATSITNVPRDAVVQVTGSGGKAAWPQDSAVVFFSGVTGPIRAYQRGVAKTTVLNVSDSFGFAPY